MLSGWWTSLSVLTGLSSPSTSTVSDVTFVGSFGSSTILQTRPFVDLKFGVSRLWATRLPRPGVDDVDDVAHARPLVVCDVLDADELEHVVDVAPVLEHPLRAVDADRASWSAGRSASCRSVGGNGYPLSAAFSSEPSGLRPVAMSFGTLMKWPVTTVPDPGTTS